MASITSTSGVSSILGQYSGIGSEQIEQLLEADKIPKLRAQNKIESIQAEKTAWSDIKTRLNNFLKKVEDLQKLDTFQTKKTTSSDSSSVAISATADAAEGKFRLQVNQLATSTELVGKRLDTSETALATSGELTITSADTEEAFTFSVDAKDSLKDVAAKINAETKNSNISATIVDNRLVLQDKKTGERTFTVDGSAKEALGLGEEAKFNLGQDAKFTLNGIEITRQFNIVEDVVEGVTFELLQETEKEISLSLTNDTSKLKTAVKDFVSQYNSLMSFISEKIDVGDPSKEDNEAGALAGDSTLVRLQSELRNLIVPPYNSANSSLRASDVGLSIADREGTLTLDETKFDTILAKDPEELKKFFFQSEKVAGETKTSGYSIALKDVADKYLSEKSGNKGIIAVKFETYESTIKDLNKQIERFDTLIDQKKERYVNMFTRLDQAMMQAEEQMSWLLNQVNSWSSN